MQILRKISRLTNISYSLIHLRTSAYQGERNVSFSEYFTHVLHGWSLNHLTVNHFQKTAV